ncbi:MAG: type II toxin-antitoxin system RelE/ParE family toxin [Pseudomonadota bacterium]|nr:type II toxin-antitoxin system RelE/ParE family toxin [Gammaproteobacteria bacterium]MDQ3581741.1 type II toxin-antitoxin system RelE/ParE family toxin [Pseudomonadota bacterium]
MRVHWTAKALHRLQQIHDHIAHDQPQNAKRFVDRLTLRAEAIALYPQAGRIVPEYGCDTVRETFEGRYRIIYRIRPDRIDILTVRHGARLLPARTQDL